jgi:hypothetical protein
MDACQDAGVKLGAYDAKILAWLAIYEPETCAVITGLISRANIAGQAAPRTGQAGRVRTPISSVPADEHKP